jgi:hypothetical protein
MPNVESVRVIFEVETTAGSALDIYLFHRDCWRGQVGRVAHLIEADGAERCAECRRRLDGNE